MPLRHSWILLAAALAVCSVAHAATYSVSNTNNSGSGSLRQAILDANASGAYVGIVNGSNTIDVSATGTIALSDALPMIFSNLTINGNDITIDGGNAHRCFFVSGLPLAATPDGAPQAIAVALNDLRLDNCLAKGGDGGDGGYGGGGGLGAGGAVFVNANANVTLSNVAFSGNAAVGGSGGNPISGGSAGGGGIGGRGGAGGGGTGSSGSGGGIGGAGGTGAGQSNGASGGGGGIGGAGGNSGTGVDGGSGGGGFGGTGIGQIAATQGFGSAAAGDPGSSGGTNGGGGGGGGSGATSGQSGSGSGAGGSGGSTGGGGGGGFSAGAGGANVGGGVGGGGGGDEGSGIIGGAGGFGGGGATQRNGGFGGGGGAYSNGGFGGGKGSNASYPYGGGGGGALGGAVFVVDGGSVTFAGAGSLGAGTLVAGASGDSNAKAGSTFGAGMFLHGNGTLVFDLTNSALYTLSDGIADTQGSGGGVGSGSWGILVDGDGTGTLLMAAPNAYSGPTDVVSGTLAFDWGQVQSCVPNYQVPMSGYSQSGVATLSISADYCGDNVQPDVSGTASLAGTLLLRFNATPLIGATYKVLTAGTLDGTFDRSATIVENSGTPKSVFGEMTYATRADGTRAALYSVIATDEIFRDSFEPNSTYTGACVTKQQFADNWGTLLQDTPICVPPFTVSGSGITVVACQSSTCPATGTAGCQTMLHTSPGSLTGTLDTSYDVATPLTADDFTGPLHITGFAGTVDCTGTLSNTSAYLDTTYWASHDYLGDAFVYQFVDAQVQGLTTNLSTQGCGPLYDAATSFVQPYVIQQMQTQINNMINSYIPTGASDPGVGDTICPAP